MYLNNSFRLDRMITLMVYHTWIIKQKPKGIRIPILMYHSISDEPENGHPYYWINTSPKRFTEQMKFLHDNNYGVIDLSEAVKLIESSGLNSVITDNKPEINNCSLHPTPSNLHPDKFVVLTFDDGYRDFYTQAFPILKRYDFSATVFLPTAFINESKDGLRGKKHLDWDQVRKLQGEAISFGSHTVRHPQIFDLTMNEIEYEVISSKKEIEDKIGNNVESFCYPYKFPEQDRRFLGIFRDILQKARYKNGVCTRIGTYHTYDDIFYLRRIPINSGDDMPFFRAKLVGGCDWISKIQLISKKLNKQWCSNSTFHTQ